jgi:hypothetical protein
MKKLLVAVAVTLFPFAAFGAPADKDEPKGDKVEFSVHDGYFESNKSGLKGDASFLAFNDQEAFNKTFGMAVVMGKKRNFLPKDAFDTKIVAAVIKRGNAITEYKVEKVTADGKTLYVQYRAKEQAGGGTATYASPLIVSVDKGKITSVVFIEGDKKVGTAEFGK